MPSGDREILQTVHPACGLTNSVLHRICAHPTDANPFLLDLAAFPPLDGPDQEVLTGAALGEKDLLEEGEGLVEEIDEGVLVDNTAGSSGSPRRKSERKVARSALQEVEAEEGEGGIDALPRTGNKAAVLLFDPDDDIDDV